MNREKKAEGSQEGAGLSDSLHPVAWMRIWSLGDSGFILEGPGRFIDAMKPDGAREIADHRLGAG